MNWKARWLLATVLMVLFTGITWLGGYDFNSRGPEAVMTVLWVIAGWVIGITCPLFDGK